MQEIVMECWERRPDGRELHFARVTDLPRRRRQRDGRELLS